MRHAPGAPILLVWPGRYHPAISSAHNSNSVHHLGNGAFPAKSEANMLPILKRVSIRPSLTPQWTLLGHATARSGSTITGRRLKAPGARRPVSSTARQFPYQRRRHHGRSASQPVYRTRPHFPLTILVC